MFSKQVQKIHNLLSEGKQQQTLPLHSIGPITRNICSRTMHFRAVKTSRPKYQSEISLLKQELPPKYTQILYQLFKSKCLDMSLEANQKNYDAFIKSFLLKNKVSKEEFMDETINLNDFSLGQKCLRQINLLLKANSKGVIIKLNKNILNPNHLVRIQTLKELSLCNCKLGNDVLQELFNRLQQSVIQKISLSSPQVKNRNQLTRYKALIALIQKSTTLHTLQLSNIEIQPDNMILQSSRNTSLKHIDLSDNTNVKGLCVSLNSLNLSRNSIVYPFSFPMAANQISYLNLSHNKIPNFHLKEFLKHIYFANLKHLILDHNKLDGDMSAIQVFLQNSITIQRLSLVECQFSQLSFTHIMCGLKHSKTLQMIDLSHNKVANQRIAECIAHTLQASSFKELRMRHCQIKDNWGEIIFKNIRRNKSIEKIDMTSNLLGDRTAKTICLELQSAKNITCLLLEKNTIKYADSKEIQSYLQGNKYFNVYELDKEYNKLIQINNQIKEASLIINSEESKIVNLQKQTEQLHEQYLNKFKIQNKKRKEKIKEEIYCVRDEQNMLMTDITFLQALPSLTEMNSIQSRKQSFLQLQSFANLSNL